MTNQKEKIKEEPQFPFQNIVLIFVLISVVGWIWEVIYRLIRKGMFINRGFLFGPWIPIYGLGTLLVIFIYKKLHKKPVLYTLSILVSCASLEYLISLVLEYIFHMKYWDYKRYFMNLNGRICLESVLGFTIAGILAGYFLIPWLNKLINKINPKVKKILCIIFLCLFIIDLTYSIFNPNTGTGISWQVNK